MTNRLFYESQSCRKILKKASEGSLDAYDLSRVFCLSLEFLADDISMLCVDEIEKLIDADILRIYDDVFHGVNVLANLF